jgi:tyrosyl-tRNA synthetase
MMAGLGKGEEKMSKSKPDSAIFMEDDERTVVSKINKAYCPPRQVRANPCLEYLRHIVFPKLGSLTIVRKDESGGNRYVALAAPTQQSS